MDPFRCGRGSKQGASVPDLFPYDDGFATPSTSGPWMPEGSDSSRPVSIASILGHVTRQADAELSNQLAKPPVSDDSRRQTLTDLIEFLRTTAPPPSNLMSIPDDASSSSSQRKSGLAKVFRRRNHSRGRRASGRRSHSRIKLPDSVVVGKTIGGHKHIAISIPLEHAHVGPWSRSQYPVYGPKVPEAHRLIGAGPGTSWAQSECGVVRVLSPVEEDRESICSGKSFELAPPPAPTPLQPAPPTRSPNAPSTVAASHQQNTPATHGEEPPAQRQATSPPKSRGKGDLPAADMVTFGSPQSPEFRHSLLTRPDGRGASRKRSGPQSSVRVRLPNCGPSTQDDAKASLDDTAGRRVHFSPEDERPVTADGEGTSTSCESSPAEQAGRRSPRPLLMPESPSLDPSDDVVKQTTFHDGAGAEGGLPTPHIVVDPLNPEDRAEDAPLPEQITAQHEPVSHAEGGSDLDKVPIPTGSIAERRNSRKKRVRERKQRDLDALGTKPEEQASTADPDALTISCTTARSFPLVPRPRTPRTPDDTGPSLRRGGTFGPDSQFAPKPSTESPPLPPPPPPLPSPPPPLPSLPLRRPRLSSITSIMLVADTQPSRAAQIQQAAAETAQQQVPTVEVVKASPPLQLGAQSSSGPTPPASPRLAAGSAAAQSSSSSRALPPDRTSLARRRERNALRAMGKRGDDGGDEQQQHPEEGKQQQYQKPRISISGPYSPGSGSGGGGSGGGGGGSGASGGVGGRGVRERASRRDLLRRSEALREAHVRDLEARLRRLERGSEGWMRELVPAVERLERTLRRMHEDGALGSGLGAGAGVSLRRPMPRRITSSEDEAAAATAAEAKEWDGRGEGEWRNDGKAQHQRRRGSGAGAGAGHNRSVSAFERTPLLIDGAALFEFFEREHARRRQAEEELAASTRLNMLRAPITVGRQQERDDEEGEREGEERVGAGNGTGNDTVGGRSRGWSEGSGLESLASLASLEPLMRELQVAVPSVSMESLGEQKTPIEVEEREVGSFAEVY